MNRLRLPLFLTCLLMLSVLIAPRATLAQTPVPPTPGQGSPTAVPTSYPAGTKLLRQSLVATRSTLSTAHGSQTTSLHDTAPNHPNGTIQLTGACALTRRSLSVTVTERGHYAPAPAFTTAYVVIASASTSHTWARSAQTRNRWALVDFAQIGGQMLMVCPSLYLREFAGQRMANRGPATISGHLTWHLHASQALHGDNHIEDLYLDQASLYPVRIVLDQKRPSFHYHVVTEYTSFNAPVLVSPPASPGGPPPPLTGGLSVVVSPNPMPGSTTPTMTVTAAHGSRCTARVLYSTSPTSGSVVAKSLGSRTIGTTGTVRWTWKVRAQALGGAAVVDCSVGRSSTNQVASFYIFS